MRSEDPISVTVAVWLAALGWANPDKTGIYGVNRQSYLQLRIRNLRERALA